MSLHRIPGPAIERPGVVLRLTGRQHEQLRRHLYPGDGNEAVALALCGRRLGAPGDGPWGSRHVLTVHEVVLVPYEACHERTPSRVSWPTDAVMPAIQKAARRGLAIAKFHSHPNGYGTFSAYDDASDRALFPSVMGWVDDGGPHASAVMLPGGEIFARAAYDDGRGGVTFVPTQSVVVVGDEIRIWRLGDGKGISGAEQTLPEFTRRHAQAFGAGTTAALRGLSVAVVGVSGTGSPVVEMLVRLGVGEIILIDPDLVEEKNLNRILNATVADIGRPKVEVVADAVRRMGLGTRVVALSRSLFDPDVVRRVALADALFGCVDSVDGRDLMNRIAAYYNLPFIDVGVRLDADGVGGVEAINGTVHYVQPDGSSLLSRGAYTPEGVRAAALRRTDPELYVAQRKEKYVLGVEEDRPAVISVNTFFASMAVNELLARLHPYRDDPNRRFAVYRASLTQARFMQEPEGEPCPVLSSKAGCGDCRPLLGMPELSERFVSEEAA